MPKKVQITIDWQAFAHLLNTGAATRSAVEGTGDSNPTKAMFQQVLVLNGTEFAGGHFKTGDAGRRLVKSNPDVVIRALLGESQLPKQSVSSLGFAKLVAVYRLGAAAMPREYAYAAGVLAAYATYHGAKSIDDMITEPTSKARQQSGVDQSQIDAIWS